MNYEKFVEAARLTARDIQRARWISNLMTDIRTEKRNITDLENEEKALLKRTSIADFMVRKANEDGDPREEDLIQTAKQINTYVTEEIEKITKEKEHINKNIENLNKDIEEVSNGTKKVDYDTMVDTAKQLMAARFGKSFNDGDYDNQTIK